MRLFFSGQPMHFSHLQLQVERVFAEHIHSVALYFFFRDCAIGSQKAKSFARMLPLYACCCSCVINQPESDRLALTEDGVRCRRGNALFFDFRAHTPAEWAINCWTVVKSAKHVIKSFSISHIKRHHRELNHLIPLTLTSPLDHFLQLFLDSCRVFSLSHASATAWRRRIEKLFNDFNFNVIIAKCFNKL